MSVTLSHVSLVASDLDRTGRVLKTAFDAREVERGDGSARDRERFYLVGPEGADETHGGSWLAVVLGPPASERLFDHLAFHVPEDEFRARVERVRSLGMDAVVLPEDDEPGGRSLRFYDHDGHLFELHTGALAERLREYDAGASGGDPDDAEAVG